MGHFTARDYIALAAALARARSQAPPALKPGVDLAAMAIAATLAASNRAFDVDRFLRDCGMPE